ncbi:DMT family transporter [Zymobacter sp. IVIA_12111.31 C1]|uniref:DMT family transporter n=1 Tax=Zymobacter sp. IVIA_12111.31 C1 TaxID=3394854 RepID=UPI0039C2329D
MPDRSSLPVSSPTETRLAYLSLLGTMIMFGSAFASSKIVVGEMPATVAAALRFAGGGIVLALMAVLFRDRTRVISYRAMLSAALAGLIGVFGYNVFFFWALTLAPSLDGSIIIPVLSPLLTSGLMIGFGRETAAPSRLAGLLIGLIGAAIFLYGAGNASVSNGRLWGDMLFLLAAGCWATYSILSKTLLAKGSLGALQATACATSGGALGLILLAAPQWSTVAWGSISPTVWFNVFFLIVGPTALASMFYFYGLRHVKASSATLMMLLVPACGAFFSIALLGETLALLQCIGVLVLILGALIALNPFRLARR